MKHFVVEDETHEIIAFYCFVNRKKINKFVDNKLKNLPEIKKFKKLKKKLFINLEDKG